MEKGILFYDFLTRKSFSYSPNNLRLNIIIKLIPLENNRVLCLTYKHLLFIEFNFDEETVELLIEKEIATGKVRNFYQRSLIDPNFIETKGFAMAVSDDEKYVFLAINSNNMCHSFDVYEENDDDFELVGRVMGKKLEIDSCLDVSFMGKFGKDYVFFGHDNEQLELYVFGKGKLRTVFWRFAEETGSVC
jgi:hypothetical protein